MVGEWQARWEDEHRGRPAYIYALESVLGYVSVSAPRTQSPPEAWAGGQAAWLGGYAQEELAPPTTSGAVEEGGRMNDDADGRVAHNPAPGRRQRGVNRGAGGWCGKEAVRYS